MIYLKVGGVNKNSWSPETTMVVCVPNETNTNVILPAPQYTPLIVTDYSNVVMPVSVEGVGAYDPYASSYAPFEGNNNHDSKMDIMPGMFSGWA